MSTTSKAFTARKISLTTTSKLTPGGGVLSVGALPLAPAVPPPGPPEEAESGAGRKRRWGSSTATTAKKTSITTASLQSLMPDAKLAAGWSQEALVDVHPEEGCLSGGDWGANGGRDLEIRRTITQVIPAESQENGQKKREEEEEEEGGGDGRNMLKEFRKDGSVDVALETQAPPTSEADAKRGDMLVRRSISQQKVGVSVTIDDHVRTTRQPSPPHGTITNIVHISNLVRPFTLGQLKELLNRTGTVVEEGFWIDQIKSHCCVTYSSSDEAMATRTALHGVKWPQSNPKFLSVDFCEQEELDFHRGVLVPERRRRERKSDKKEEPSGKMLDDLFSKTKASPCIYWLPLTEPQALQREAERADRMKEREKRRREQTSSAGNVRPRPS
ncbi:hypothetical protein AAFF_G00277610 [Aldrovandia affinis]|uniref:Uncharacterized protein n=1 Tax=Aldrovandia affinis TaxID=143900 RepID=A0AAD7W212_9TELE|nr:hypothetical protein AAFF_G00277610 [Aldrovandia affinis]